MMRSKLSSWKCTSASVNNNHIPVDLPKGALQIAIDGKKLDAKKPITTAALIEAGVIKRARDGVRILGKGELKAKVQLEVAGASKSAIEAVEKAGGSVTIVAAAPKPEAKADKPAAKADEAGNEKSDDEGDA